MYDNFPYSNFHDLNTDWIVKKIKDVETSEANAKDSEENAKASELASAQSATASAQSATSSAQSATSSAQSAQDASETVANTNAQVALLQSRVDNIVPSGTQTEGNTELIDIRVAEDGQIYNSAGNAVRGQVRNIKNVLTYLNSIVSNYGQKINYDSVQTGIYRYSTNTIVSTSTGRVRKYSVANDALAYLVTTSAYGNDTTYPLISYFNANDEQLGYEYPSVAGGTVVSINKAYLNIPDNTSYFYVNARVSSGIPQSEVIKVSYDDVDFRIPDNNIESFLDLMGDVVTPDEIIPNRMYRASNNTFTETTTAKVKKYVVNSDITYFVSSSIYASSVNYPIITYFDANDSVIGTQWDSQSNVTITARHEKLIIPDNTSYFYVNSRYTDSEVRGWTETSEQISNYVNQKQISILFVGNSLTQDGIAYLPYLLKNYYPNIKFKFYIWYNGGYTLEQQYQKFVNDKTCGIFSVSENSASWTNSNNSVTMNTILSSYTFDIVCLQEYFNYKESYTVSDLSDWNNCKNYIQSHYTGGNGLEFISLFHAPLRSNADSVFNLTKEGNGLILKNTISEDMIPMGIAIYRAMSTSLDSLGDQGHLSNDGTHAQEGLPCLLETYTVLCWLFDKLDINKSVYGLPFRITTEIYNTINVPGANLGTGVITGTDAQNLLAQEVAIQAYKEGKQFVINNLF